MSHESSDTLPQGHIEAVSLKKALEERYLAYALSTIMNRALPDVRDGLKPVHRRIIYAMRQLNLLPDRSLVKCARIIGEVMGKFHPHGDQSIYDALVRMAQDFSMRYPLVDGQGNFGNIDGDNAAAMRYTEARMTSICMTLLEGITEDAVHFRSTYNEEDLEPEVLPGAFPNLLANGSSGIAVGMAVSVPPHNVEELCHAALCLIDNPCADIEDLVCTELPSSLSGGNKKVAGPDFPTGGVIIDDRETILEAYRTGRGSFRVRAKWTIEEAKRTGYQVIVTEIPYGIQKSRLVEKMAELILARKLPLLDDVRDESTEEIRLVLIPRNRHTDVNLFMESIFRQTDLEIRFPLNMNVLSQGKIPTVLSLKDVLSQWLEHRCDVLVRRFTKRLSGIRRQLEIIAGHLIACINIDELIAIIREEDHPKPLIITRWSLTELQAETILDLRLRQLRKLEQIEIQQKHEGLSREAEEVEAVLSSEKKQWQVIRYEIEKIRDMFGVHTAIGKRRTGFVSAPSHHDQEIASVLSEKEPTTVIISEKGWMKTVRGHVRDSTLFIFKNGDCLKLFLHAMTTDRIILLTNKGRFHGLDVVRPGFERGHGEPLRIMLDMIQGEDMVTAFIHEPSQNFLVISRQGYGFVVNVGDVLANTRRGKQVMNVISSDEVAFCLPVLGTHVAIIGKNRKMLVFPVQEIPVMTRARGVRLQGYPQGGSVLDVRVFSIAEGLSWEDKTGRLFKKSARELAQWQGKRGTMGHLLPRGFYQS